MRTFFALELPEAAREAVAALSADLGSARGARADALHLTLRFLGEIDEAARTELVSSAREHVWTAPTIALRGVGVFGALERARVLWVGVAPDPALLALAEDLEAMARSAGLLAETRAFAPHVTLARLKKPHLTALQSFLRKHESFEVPAFRAHELVLMRSRTEQAGARYEVIDRFALAP